jgi:hypothetical protein
MHFLDMPFYETGAVKKKPLGEEDIRVTMDIWNSLNLTRCTQQVTFLIPMVLTVFAWQPFSKR